METLKYCKVKEVKSPVRGTSVAAGIDFFVPTNITVDEFLQKCEITKCGPEYTLSENGHIEKIVLRPGDSVMIPSGIKMKVMDGWALVFMNKSGIGAKKQLAVLACVIDQDYEGEVHINLVNTGNEIQTISAGDKIVQGVLLPMNYALPEEVENEEVLFANSESARGEGGFGSTGSR
jgi:dUTP pyrophosphatase